MGNIGMQGGRKVILDGGSLVIRKMVFFQRISYFKFFHYIKSKKMGAPRDTRGPQFRPPCKYVFSRFFFNVVKVLLLLLVVQEEVEKKRPKLRSSNACQRDTVDVNSRFRNFF